LVPGPFNFRAGESVMFDQKMKLIRHGITRDDLISRMGGSP
jgi:hypothetical protein